MSRRIKNSKISITEIFNELTEIFDKKIETEFKKIDYGEYIAYSFKTNSSHEYELEFHYSDEYCDTVLNDNIILGDVINSKCDNYNIECFDIAFTQTIVKDKDNPDEFEQETNKNEHIELMGRIAFIIGNLINEYSKINLFVVGNSRRNKNIIYETIFKNHFIDKFDLFKGESKWHNGESLFIIRK